MNDKTQKSAPDYGEPWTPAFRNSARTSNGYDHGFMDSFQKRAIACVNACAGLTDPAAEIQAMRDAIKEAHEALLRVSECKIFYAESRDIDNHTTDDCATALTNLKHFLK